MKLAPILLAAPAVLLAASPASAGPAASATINAETTDYSDGRGSLRTVALEYRRDLGMAEFMVAPTWAQQRLGGRLRRAPGARAMLGLALSSGVTSITTVAAARNEGIVPRLDLGQEIGVALGGKATAALGLRHARYSGEDVVFASASVRRYFRGGSVAYRLTRTAPERGPAFFAHLASLSLNDAAGGGRSQLWLGYGASADNRLPTGEALSGKDVSIALRRVQPLGGCLSLAPVAGYASHALPGRRVSAVNLGLELSLALD